MTTKTTTTKKATTKTAPKPAITEQKLKPLTSAMKRLTTNQVEAEQKLATAQESAASANTKKAEALDKLMPTWVNYHANRGSTAEKCKMSPADYATMRSIRGGEIAMFEAAGIAPIKYAKIIADTKKRSLYFTGAGARHPEVAAKQKAAAEKVKKAQAKLADSKTDKESNVLSLTTVAAFVAESPENCRDLIKQTIAGLHTFIDSVGRTKAASSKVVQLKDASQALQDACEAMAAYIGK